MKFLMLCSLLLGTACADIVNFHSIVEEVNSAQTTWKADTNFSEVDISSIKELLGTKLSNYSLQDREFYSLTKRPPIPEEFDARQKWSKCPTIGHISDQSRCGSCWAVAAADVFSDRLCIATNSKFTEPLSALYLLSCCKNCGNGCDGGYLQRAWEFFKETGIVTGGPNKSGVGCQPYPFPLNGSETSYKTPKCNEECTNPAYKKPFKEDFHKVKSVYSIKAGEIQEEILTRGPVEAAFIVYEDFPTYKSGVYKHISGKEIGAHAVRIIGWGKENGIPYWLIANSWGTGWGDHGFFKMLRGTNECSIESYVIAGVPAEK